MHAIGMFDRKGPLTTDGFEGSGANFMPVQGRIRGRMPTVLPMSATGMSHLGNSGLNLYLSAGIKECRRL